MNKENLFEIFPSRPQIIIDVPPRYLSSDSLHLGHAIQYLSIDILARTKLKLGYNVIYPLCYDGNGIPIERVAERQGANFRDDLPGALNIVRQICDSFIDGIRRGFYSLDIYHSGSVGYRTDSPEYRDFSRIEFEKLLDSGLAYKTCGPEIWCPVCNCSLSNSEVEFRKISQEIYNIKIGDRQYNSISPGPHHLVNGELYVEDGWIYPEGSILISGTPIYPEFQIKDNPDIMSKQNMVVSQGICWRCANPLTIQFSEHFKIKILEYKSQILAAINEINWNSNRFKNRLISWVNSLNSDWNASRRRFYGTPIGDGLVQDTWVDSSMTPLYLSDIHGGVTDYRFQSHDILRTWAMYSIVRAIHRGAIIPFKNLIVTSYVLDSQGRGMHTSIGNILDPIELSGGNPDLLRYSLMDNDLGSDLKFGKELVNKADKIRIKIENFYRYYQNVGSPIPGDTILDLSWIEDRSILINSLDNLEYPLARRAINRLISYFSQAIIPRHRRGEIPDTLLGKYFYDMINIINPVFPRLTDRIYQEMSEGYLSRLEFQASMM